MMGVVVIVVINGETEQIPSDASTSRSDCSSSSYSAFVLDFNTLFTEWEIVLNFTIGEDSFKLHTLAASKSTLGTPLSSSETTDFFDVPLGDYYTCSHFNYSIGFLQLNLTNPSLQPFVQKTGGGDNLGQLLALMCVPDVCYAYNNTTTGPATTTESNMTTENGTTSTIPSVTSGARWQVKDMGGKLCMLMDFGGTITDVINGVTVQIPSDASTSRSDCSSSSYSAFVLDFNTLFTKWEIVLNFTIGEDSFKLHTLSASRSTLGTPLSSSETADFFNVPVGDYYTCSHFNYRIGFLQLNLTNPSLQPFIQKTEGGDNLGQPYVCRPAQSDSLTIINLDRYTAIGLGLGIPSSLIVLFIVVVKKCNREDQSCCDCSGDWTICGNCCNETHPYGNSQLDSPSYTQKIEVIKLAAE